MGIFDFFKSNKDPIPYSIRNSKEKMNHLDTLLGMACNSSSPLESSVILFSELLSISSVKEVIQICLTRSDEDITLKKRFTEGVSVALWKQPKNIPNPLQKALMEKYPKAFIDHSISWKITPMKNLS